MQTLNIIRKYIFRYEYIILIIDAGRLIVCEIIHPI